MNCIGVQRFPCLYFGTLYSVRPEGPGLRQRIMIRKLGILGLFVIAWLLYSWTARSDGMPFAFERRTTDYYNLLTDGFLAGHLYFPVTPDPKLLQLADPYDPVQNNPYRPHDVSLYRGKFYLYFGAAPAVTLLLPFRLLTDMRIPENLAVAIFLFAGLVVSYWSFQFLIRRFAPKTPGYFSFIAVVLFGFCNFALFILRRPAFYEQAIASGYFYFFAGAYFLLTGLFGKRKSNWRLVAASACFGLTIASRPNYIFVALGALCAAGIALVWDGEKRIPVPARRTMLALILPFTCVMALILIYNYLRFDSIFEFGQSYQLSGFRTGKLFSFEYSLRNIKTYMLASPYIDRRFPFFHLQIQRAQMYSDVYGEPLGGALTTTPLVGLNFLLIPIWIGVARYRSRFGYSMPLAILATLFGLSCLVMVLFLSFFGGLTQRYAVDFIPSFLFSAILVWVILYQSLQKRPHYRWALNAFLILLLAFQVVLNLGVSITGYYDSLHEENPAAYSKIQSWFSFIEQH
jgi:hypothetical protein